jgi:Family of unknown function (DUF6200)
MQQELAPIIIDLGKKRRKVIKDLKRGRGKAMSEVERALNEIRASMGPDAEGRELVPVVLIYRKKEKKSGNGRNRGFGLLGPL